MRNMIQQYRRLTVKRSHEVIYMQDCMNPLNGFLRIFQSR